MERKGRRGRRGRGGGGRRRRETCSVTTEGEQFNVRSTRESKVISWMINTQFGYTIHSIPFILFCVDEGRICPSTMCVGKRESWSEVRVQWEWNETAL